MRQPCSDTKPFTLDEALLVAGYTQPELDAFKRNNQQTYQSMIDAWKDAPASTTISLKRSLTKDAIERLRILDSQAKIATRMNDAQKRQEVQQQVEAVIAESANYGTPAFSFVVSNEEMPLGWSIQPPLYSRTASFTETRVLTFDLVDKPEIPNV